MKVDFLWHFGFRLYQCPQTDENDVDWVKMTAEIPKYVQNLLKRMDNHLTLYEINPFSLRMFDS